MCSYSPKDQIIVLPAVAQLQDKLLPDMSDSPQSTVVIIDQTQTQSQPIGQTVTGCRLQLAKKILGTAKQKAENIQSTNFENFVITSKLHCKLSSRIKNNRSVRLLFKAHSINLSIISVTQVRCTQKGIHSNVLCDFDRFIHFTFIHLDDIPLKLWTYQIRCT